MREPSAVDYEALSKSRHKNLRYAGIFWPRDQTDNHLVYLILLAVSIER